MTNRLDYQTLGGDFSASTTFEQLIEFVRLAEEDFKQLADWAKVHENPVKAKAWIQNAEAYAKIIPILAYLGKGKTKTSVGFRQ
jgi:plasmid stabilization system protein ParE